MDLGKMVRVVDVATELGITISAVYQSISDPEGGLVGAKCGSAWWVTKESVQNYKPREYPRRLPLGGADVLRE